MKVGNKNKINDQRFELEAELVSTLFESVKTGLKNSYSTKNFRHERRKYTSCTGTNPILKRRARIEHNLDLHFKYS